MNASVTEQPFACNGKQAVPNTEIQNHSSVVLVKVEFPPRPGLFALQTSHSQQSLSEYCRCKYLCRFKPYYP